MVRPGNANVQADMNIRGAHLSEGTFSDVAAQLYQNIYTCTKSLLKVTFAHT